MTTNDKIALKRQLEDALKRLLLPSICIVESCADEGDLGWELVCARIY